MLTSLLLAPLWIGLPTLPSERTLHLDVPRVRERAASGRLPFVPRTGTLLPLVLGPERAGALSQAIVRGHIEGEPGSWARLVFHEAVLHADVFSPSLGLYELRWSGNGRHSLRHVDRNAREICLGALSSPTPPRLGQPGGGSVDAAPQAVPRPEVRIDVLVVYTPSARTLAGGVAPIEATIDAYIDYANQAYEDCGVNQFLNLVGSAETAYVESGNSITDLVRLRNLSDGFMDEVHVLRDSLAADCVSLIATSGSAGTAYLMDDVSPTFQDRAFSAIGHNVGGLAFTHELGHNMGCGHNNFAGAPPAAFCFSYGHRTLPGQTWRTIMANGPGTLIDFFSSPDKSFLGLPLGVSGDGCPTDAADCVRTLNATAATVAGFRP